MKYLVLGVTIVLAAAAAPRLPAADAAGNYAIWGAGGRSCHQYTATRSKPVEAADFDHFLMGYLTAYGALAPDTYSIAGTLSLEKSLNWLNDYCTANQMDSFERAISQFIAVQPATRLRTPPGAASSGWGRALPPPPPTAAEP